MTGSNKTALHRAVAIGVKDGDESRNPQTECMEELNLILGLPVMRMVVVLLSNVLFCQGLHPTSYTSSRGVTL